MRCVVVKIHPIKNANLVFQPQLTRRTRTLTPDQIVKSAHLPTTRPPQVAHLKLNGLVEGAPFLHETVSQVPVPIPAGELARKKLVYHHHQPKSKLGHQLPIVLGALFSYSTLSRVPVPILAGELARRKPMYHRRQSKSKLNHQPLSLQNLGRRLPTHITEHIPLRHWSQ